MLAKLKSRGVLYLFGIAINRMVPEFLFRARVFCVFRFVSYDSSSLNPSSSLASYDDGIHFQWCENESQFEIAKRLTFFEPAESRDQRSTQRSPYQACLAFDGDEAVGGVWIASDSFDESELQLQIQLQPQQRWLFAANIARSHRRRGIYGRMLRYVLSTVGENGDSCQVLASINPANKASMAAHRPMNDEILGKCVAARFLSLSFCGSTEQLRTTRAIGLGKATVIKIES